MSMYDDVVKRRKERDKETEKKSVSSMYDIAFNKRKAGIDTIEQDYSNLASNLSKAYSGWQTPETMSNLSSSVDDMKGRLTAYGRWARYTGNENADSITNLASRFESVPSTIRDLSKAYSGYKDKTAFDSAVRIEKEKESAKKYHTEADYDKRIQELTEERSKLKGMDTVPLYNAIQSLKKLKTDFSKNPNSKYEAFRDAEDFEEKSKAVEGRGGNTTANQQMYKFINNPVVPKKSDNPDVQRINEANQRLNQYNKVTDEEKALYNYLYNSGRYEEAEDYINNLGLSSRVLEAQKDYATEQYRNMNGLQRTLASLVMIPANIGLSAYNGVVDLANMATGGNLTGNDVYEGFKTIGQGAEQAASIPHDVQSQIMGEKFGKAGQIGYEAVYSALNSLAGVSALGHGFEVVMGLGAAHDTYNELSQTDTPMAQTIIKSLSAGVLEALFEHLPTETLLQMSKNTTSLRQLVANLLKVGAEEGLEEAGTEASNNIVDLIVGQISEAMGGENTSKLKGAFDEYVARGYSAPKAKEMVFKDVLQNVTTAGVTGALSGMLMGGSSAIDLGINNSVGKQVIHPEALAEVAKTYGSDFADYVAKLQSNPTNAEKGAIYRQISDKVDASTLNLIGKWTEGKEDTDLENKVVSARANVEKSVTKTEADEQREGDKRSDAEIVQSMGSEYAEDVQKVFTDNYEGQNPYEYKALFDLAYENGARATGLSEVLTSQNISADAIKNIYKAGVSSRSVVESKLNEITKDFSKLHIKKGMGRFDDSAVDTSKLTKAQKETVALLHAFSDKMGVNITLYQSTAEEQRSGKANGWYDPKTNSIHVDVNAGLGGTKIQEAIIIPTVSHEITHWSKTKALDLYNKLSESVFDALYESDGISADARIEAEKERLLKNEGIEADDDYARDEVVARACEDMLKNSKTVDKYLKKMNVKELSTFKEKVAEIFDSIIEFFHELASAFSSEKAEAIAIRQMEDKAMKLQKQWDAMLDKAIQTNKGQMTDVQLMDSIKTEVNTTALEEAGAVVYDDGSVLMSPRMYEEEGKGLLKDYLKDLVDAKEIDEADAKDIVDNLDRVFQYARSLENSGEFVSFSNWAKAEAINLSDGGVLSVRVPNGEYAYNFDFSTICKKRKALDTVLNLMIKNPDFNVNTLTKTGIAKLNNLIKANGFEIACALCFVDSKRYNIRDWANSLCYGSEDKETKTHKMGYNDMIDVLEKASGLKATEFKFTSDDNKNIASNEHDVIKAFAAKVKDNTAITVEKGSLADIEGYDFSDTIVYKMVADFDKEYNEASEWLASHPNASEDEKEEHKKPTENEQVRIARTLLDNPSLRQRLNPKDLIEGEGLDNIMIASEPLYRLVHMHGGTSKPKEAHHSVAYDNVVINDKNLTADKVKYVGGARLQSFSDFMANMFFDYCQLFTDLQAKDIPLQAYTKEEAFIRIFGMTGVKANMSIVFKGAELTDEEAKYFDSLSDAKKKTDAKYLEKKKYAGLKVKDEYKGQNIADLIKNKVFDAFDYIIEDESFASDVNAAEGHKGEKGFETAKKLQKMPQFMHNIGIIGVGVSDLHILKMLDDDDIPMVIPYHKSGLNYELAKLRRIDFYNDYTGQQNTLAFKSQEVKKAFEKTHPVRNSKYYSDLLANQSQYLKKYDGKDYNFYDALYGNTEKKIPATNDPKLACDEYIKWCEDNGLVPKFYQFMEHPNYYKMIIDYKVYDYNGVEPSKVESRQYLPQYGVKLQMPEDYKEWVEKGLRLQNETDTALDEKAPRIAEIAVQVINTRGVDGNIKLWDENGNEIHGQQGKVQYSSRSSSEIESDYSSALKEGNMEKMKQLVREYAVAQGYDRVGYHGTDRWGFTAFDMNEMRDKTSIFITDDMETASTYSDSYGTRMLSDKFIKPQGIKDMSLQELVDNVNKLSYHYQVADSKVLGIYAQQHIDAINKVAERIRNTANSEVFTHIVTADNNTKGKEIDVGRLRKMVLRIADLHQQLADLEMSRSDRLDVELNRNSIMAGLESESTNRIAMDLKIITGMVDRAFVDSPYYLKRIAKAIDDGETAILDKYGEFCTREELEDILERSNSSGILDLAFKLNNPLVLDAKGVYWNRLPKIEGLDAEGNEYPPITRGYAKYAKDNGYDGVIFRNIYDVGQYADEEYRSNVYVVFNPTHVKSLDAVTYDDNGEPIPLKLRFDDAFNELRYSSRDIGYHAGNLGKAEWLSQQGRYRDTGHFGTGTYFVGDEDQINIGNYKDRPHHAVNFERYKLFRPYTSEEAFKLHNLLRYIDGGIEEGWIDKLVADDLFYIDRPTMTSLDDYTKFADEHDIEYLSENEWLENQGYYDISDEGAYYDSKELNDDAEPISLEDLINGKSHNESDFHTVKVFEERSDLDLWYADYVEEKVNKYIEEENKEYIDFSYALIPFRYRNDFKSWAYALRAVADYEKQYKVGTYKLHMDSYATTFMKALGFEGVDVRQLKDLDNTAYGSVIYDLNDADIFYSSRDLDYDIADADDAVDRIIAENKALGEDIEILNSIANRSYMKAEERYAKGVADYIIDKYGSKADEEEISKAVKRFYNVLLKGNADVVDIFNLGGEIATKILDGSEKFSELKSDEVADYIKSDMKRAVIIDMYTRMWNGVKFPNTDTKKAVDKAIERGNKALEKANAKYEEDIKSLKEQHNERIAKLREYYKDKAKESKASITKHYKDLLAKTKDDLRKKYKTDLNETVAKKVGKVKEAQARKIAIAKIIKNVKELSDMLTKNNQKKRVNEALKPIVKEILDMVDMESNYIIEGRSNKSLAKAFDKLRHVIVDEFEGNIEEDVERLFGDADLEFKNDIVVYANSLLELEKTMEGKVLNINKMDSEHLEELAKMLTYVRKAVNQTNRLFGMRRRQMVEEVATDLDNDVKKYTRSGLKSKVEGIANFFDYSMALPYYTFKRLGDTGSEIFKTFMDGWDKFAFEVSDIIDTTQAKYKELGIKDKDIRDWKNDTHDVTAVDKFGNEFTFKATSSQLMSLYCLSRREAAWKHLESSKGGFHITTTEKNGQQKGLHVMEHDAIAEMCVRELTDQQIKIAQFFQEEMSTTGSKLGNEVTLERWGIAKYLEKFYFPMKTENKDLSDKSMESKNSIFRLLNASFTNDLNQKASNGLEIGDIFEIYSSHMSDMAKYNALALPTLNLFRVWNYKEEGHNVVKNDIEYAFGEGMNHYIQQFMEDINGASSGGFEYTDSFAKKMIRNYKIAAVGANIRVAMLQPTAYVRASYVIPSKYLTMALKDVAHVREYSARAQENCGIAKWKSLGYYDTNVASGVTSKISGGGSVVENALEKSGYLAEKGDEWTWGMLYHACELEAKDKGLKDHAAQDYVNDRFREIVYQTQVVDSTMTRTQAMRSKSTIVQMATAFMTEPMQSFNMLTDGFYNYEKDKQLYGKDIAFKRNGKKIAKAFGTYLITLACASLVGAIPDWFRDDDKEYTIADYLKLVGDNALQDAFGMIPYAKDIISVAQGYSLTRMDEQFIATSFNAIKQLTNGEFNYKDVYMTAKAISQTTGIPISNVVRSIKSIYDTFANASQMWNNSVGETYPSMKVK